MTTSETWFFIWTSLFGNLQFRLKLAVCFSFCIIIYSFVCQFSFHCYWYHYNQKDSSRSVLQKLCFHKFRKISRKITWAKDLFLMKLKIYRVKLYQKRDSVTDVFFWILLLHKHWFCLLSHDDLSPFQNRCHTMSGWVFSWLNLQTRNKSELNILNP